MKKQLLYSWLLLCALITGSGTMWAETVTLVSGSGSSGYAVPDGWTSSGTVEGGSYLKFDNGTITSPEFAPHTGLSFTYSVATFGSGTNHPLTIRILNASTNAVIVEETTSTPTSSTYISTGSPLSLGNVNVAFKIQLYAPTGRGVRLRNYSITGTPAKTDPTIIFNDGSVRVGQSLNLSTLFESNSEGAVTYSITAGGSYASIDGSTLTGVAAEGSVTVKAAQAAAGNYNAGEATATITVNAALTLSSIAITTAPSKTTYTEGETFDPTGMVVTATYSDESTYNVTASCTYSPSTSTALTTSDTEISVSYTENAVEKTTTQTITVNALPKYTVTFDDGGSVTEASYGAGVTLPSRSNTAGYPFAGWSTTNVPTETTTAPTIIPAGSYTPTANITLYPVYTKTEGGATPTAFAVGNTGSYAIVSASQGGKYYALPTNPTVSGGKITAQEITVSVLNDVKYVTPTNASGFTWTIATATNGYTLSDGSHYIYHSNGGASGTNLTYDNGTSYTWSFTADGDYITMAAMEGSTTRTRGMLFQGTTIGGYALSNASTSGYYKIMLLPIVADGTTYYWSAPVAAAVERPEITVAQNPFVISTTATITCETDGAAIKYSYDGETWNDYSSALTITTATTLYAKAVKDANESTVASVAITKNLAEPTVTVNGDLTLDLDGGTDVNAGTLTAAVTYNEAAVGGATVTWSSNNTDVATIDENTGAVTILTTGTVTFTATYAGNSDYASATGTKTVTVIDNKAPGSAGNPYTVAQAIAATPGSGTSDNVYIRGIVSSFYDTSVVGDGSNYRYYISDDGTTATQLLVYKGKKNSTDNFSAASDLQIGDVVTIYGGLTTYSNAPEVASGNYIVSLVRKTVPGLAWSTDAFNAVNGEENIYPTLTNANGVAVSYSSSDETVATIANNGTITLVANGETTITASFAGNSDYLEQEVSYTLTVTGFSKNAAGIAFAESEVNITYGDEFEEPALTNPNNLTVAYTSTNGAVAQVNENTGAITIVKAGSATITATFTENEDYLGAVVSYTINVAKAAASLSFGETSFKVTPGAEFVAPTLNNPNSLTVTYSSSDEDVAMVDENTGEVVIGDEGTATITAASAETDNYLAGNATYTIVVSSELEMTWDLSSKTYTTGSNYVTWSSGYATMTNSSASGGTSATNYLGGDSNKRTSSRFYSGNTLTITPAFGYQIASIEFTATSEGYATTLGGSTWTNATATASGTTVTVTPTNSLNAITATIGGTCGFTSVKVYYKELASANITLAAQCTDGEKYYSTFSSPRAFVVPEDMTVAEIGIVDNKLYVEEYETGDIVPANTGVMVSSTMSGNHSLVFSTGGTSVLGDDNRLRASGNTGITAEAMNTADSGCKFYRLTMHNGTQIGFWWGAAEGAAFDLAANKAYLAVPNAVSARVQSFWFTEETTGIKSIDNGQLTMDNEAVYDLQGRKVQNPKRGLYIINGKKVVIK